MKHLGIALLCIGVAISAAYGARLSPSMRSQMVIRGELHVRTAEAGAAKGAFCAALLEQLEEHDERVREVAAVDGCEVPPVDGAENPDGDDAEESGVNVALICAESAAGGRSFDEIVEAAHQELRTREDTDVGGLGEGVLSTRAAWFEAMHAQVAPDARASLLERVPPNQRVTEWIADSGLFFALGLLLVIVGAVLGRVASKREATAEPEDTESGAARDLGELLDELREEVAELAKTTAENENPSLESFETLKDQITELQISKVEPIVESAPRVQAKYGLTVFADVFGPLSSAERNMNRAWSALVDRHWPEAASSLERSAAELKSARRALGSPGES